ncbi:MAG: NUDIX hydrolase [Bacteroides sp.]|nr:NUDIX hydrolase [Bacteroides sp.]
MVLIVEGRPTPCFSYSHARPALTADFILLAQLPDNSRHLLLVERGNEPFKGCFAFPGGFVEEDETLEWAAGRELREETGIRLKDYGLAPQFFRPYSEPERDPRGRTVTMVYHALIECGELPSVQGSDDAAQAGWFPVNELPELAFDHAKIWQEFSAAQDF